LCTSELVPVARAASSEPTAPEPIRSCPSAVRQVRSRSDLSVSQVVRRLTPFSVRHCCTPLSVRQKVRQPCTSPVRQCTSTGLSVSCPPLSVSVRQCPSVSVNQGTAETPNTGVQTSIKLRKSEQFPQFGDGIGRVHIAKPNSW